jgi:subtilase family serine protease
VRSIIGFLISAGVALAATAAMSAAAASGSIVPVAYKPACGVPASGHAQCLSIRIATAPKATHAAPAQTPGSYGPSDLQSAYDLTSAAASKGSGETVAIVDAYDDPEAASDLAVYRSNYGLPAAKLTIYNQDGGTTITAPPAGTNGWDIEESMDLDMVSAICPNCSIDLVEANSNSFSDLSTAANTAAGLPGVVAVSNSYGGSEFSSETTDTAFDHPGVAFTVSAGDSGFGLEFPAVSPYVTAVGGTALTPDPSVARGWSETVWGNGTEGGDGVGTGSGCSVYEPKPSWQDGITDPLCSNRTVADVAADADPATGVVIYDTYNGFGGFQSDWGGTSMASPVIAATYALAGVPAAATYPASYPYADPSDLNNVTTGSNGDCGNYLCNGGPGYNGPTGLGTPEGTAAFTAPGTPPPHKITVANPGAQSSTKGTAITPLTIKATDSDSSATLTYAASGLPAGLSIASTTGVISGTPTTVAVNPVTVTVTDGTGASGTAAFTWTVTAQPQSPSGLIKATKMPPLVVSDRNGRLANGNPIQVWHERSSLVRHETWTLVNKGSYDVIELTSSPSHCLAVRGSGVANGTKVQLWTCKTGTVNQEWKPLAAGQLEAVYASSKRGVAVVLDDPNAGGNGTRLQIWRSDGRKQQFWTVP